MIHTFIEEIRSRAGLAEDVRQTAGVIEESLDPRRLPDEFWVEESELETVARAMGAYIPRVKSLLHRRASVPGVNYKMTVISQHPDWLVHKGKLMRMHRVKVSPLNPMQSSPE